MCSYVPQQGASPEQVRAMFDRIARRYDRANRAMTLGMDRAWRRKLARKLPMDALTDGRGTLLDLGTGTGDQLFANLKARPEAGAAIGMDPAPAMIELAQKKADQSPAQGRLSFREGSAPFLPFTDDSITAITISFGVRNISDLDTTFQECLRVLQPEGKLLILESSLPTVGWIRRGHLLYVRFVVPTLGALIARDRSAYEYLHETIRAFPSGKSFCDWMTTAGFQGVRQFPLCLGAVSIYEGTAPALGPAHDSH